MSKYLPSTMPVSDYCSGAGHVDRYIGSSFDIVYEVYKRLGYFPSMLNFINHWVPLIQELEPQVENILENVYPNITNINESLHVVQSEIQNIRDNLLTSRDETLQYKLEAKSFRNESEQLKDETRGFRNEAESLKNTTHSYVGIVQQGFADLKDELSSLYVPNTTTINAGNGLAGGGRLDRDLVLAVKYGTTAGTAAQGNDSRIVNAVPNARRVNTGYGLTGGGTLGSDLDIAVKVGTTADTLAAGNDPRIVKGEEAHGWGNHASAGYATTASLAGYATAANLASTETKATGAMSHIGTLEGQMSNVLQRLTALEALNP